MHESPDILRLRDMKVGELATDNPHARPIKRDVAFVQNHQNVAGLQWRLHMRINETGVIVQKTPARVIPVLKNDRHRNIILYSQTS